MELFMVNIPQLNIHTTHIAVARSLGLTSTAKVIATPGTSYSAASKWTFTYCDMVFHFTPSRVARRPKTEAELARFCGQPELPFGTQRTP